jgi:hypothetical protein
MITTAPGYVFIKIICTHVCQLHVTSVQTSFMIIMHMYLAIYALNWEGYVSYSNKSIYIVYHPEIC